jgi:putative nucleotidyltransferase with HDIG domain
MNTIVMDDVLHRIRNLPVMPTVVMELLESMAQENVEISEVAHKISQDQALTAKTLRLANSSFYGRANQVTTIQDAIAILGLRTVRSQAMAACLIGTFAGKTDSSFDTTPFWRHAIAVAFCAKELASHLNVNAESAYITGLLHDIGRLVLVTQFQSNFAATLAYRTEHDCSLLEAEHAVLGIDHATIGHALARHWKFPDAMQHAIANHHATEVQNMEPLPLIILVANVIAHALDLSSDVDDMVPSIPSGLWNQLGLNESTLLAVFSNTEKQFEGAHMVLTSKEKKS